MQGGYGSNRGSEGSLRSGRAFISTLFSLCLFGNESRFTRSRPSFLTDLCALCWDCHAKGSQSEAACRKSHTRSTCPGGALLLQVASVLKHHVHGEGVTCPPLGLVASCPPLSSDLQGHVLATTSARSFVSGKQIKSPSCASCDSARLSPGGAKCSHTPLPSSTPADKTSQTSLLRYSKTD